ncbi:MAG TPA: hypothetical protein VFJ49_01415, partial [Methyloceanibacter sp.]|nr:hypothetical protein [Methyloceanibacter sp.]
GGNDLFRNEEGGTVLTATRNLENTDFQMGLDLGRRGLLSPSDILVFGVLGGFVNGTLDYDNISRAFDFEGGQVGGSHLS